MIKLTKEQIVGELLAEEQITAEEAVTLLTPESNSHNNNIPEVKEPTCFTGYFWEQNTTL